MASSSLKNWILEHDDSALFNVLYIGLALLLSITLGLFWLVVVVGVHAVIEIVRQYLLSGSWPFALAETLWELKLDVGLIVFAFVLAVYLEFIFGMAGLAAGSRVAAQTAGRVAKAGTRMALWKHLIRGFLLALDDIAMAARAVLSRMGGRREKEGDSVTSHPAGDDPAPWRMEDSSRDPSPPVSSWKRPYSRGDMFSLGFGLSCLLLLGLAPTLIDVEYADVASMILNELQPFPN